MSYTIKSPYASLAQHSWSLQGGHPLHAFPFGSIATAPAFALHESRQTGKTTAMLSLAKSLTENGQYSAIMVSVEIGAAFAGNLDAAELAILDTWRGADQFRLPADLQSSTWPEASLG